MSESDIELLEQLTNVKIKDRSAVFQCMPPALICEPQQMPGEPSCFAKLIHTTVSHTYQRQTQFDVDVQLLSTMGRSISNIEIFLLNGKEGENEDLERKQSFVRLYVRRPKMRVYLFATTLPSDLSRLLIPLQSCTRVRRLIVSLWNFDSAQITHSLMHPLASWLSIYANWPKLCRAYIPADVSLIDALSAQPRDALQTLEFTCDNRFTIEQTIDELVNKRINDTNQYLIQSLCSLKLQIYTKHPLPSCSNDANKGQLSVTSEFLEMCRLIAERCPTLRELRLDYNVGVDHVDIDGLADKNRANVLKLSSGDVAKLRRKHTDAASKFENYGP